MLKREYEEGVLETNLTDEEVMDWAYSTEDMYRDSYEDDSYISDLIGE